MIGLCSRAKCCNADTSITVVCVCCRFLTALVMTLAPATVAAGEADLVEEILVFSLVAGLTVGAVAGWLWLV